MQIENDTTEPQTGNTNTPADTQQTQQQAIPSGGEGAQGTAQTEGQEHQEGQQAEGEKAQRDERGRFKPGVQSRIDELTRARRDAEREAETLRQQLQQLQGGAPTSGQGPATEPQPEQFQDYGQYVKALAKWEAAQIIGARDQAQAKTLQERAQDAQQRADQAQQQAWIQRQDAARTALPDYDTVMAAAANVHVSQAVQSALMDSDRGPELAYHLAKNPALAQQLNGMSARQVDREIGRLEERLARPAPPPVSKAPTPLKPLTGSGAAAKDPSQMTDAEYRKWRLSQKT